MTRNLYELNFNAYLPSEFVEVDEGQFTEVMKQFYKDVPCYSNVAEKKAIYSTQLTKLIDELTKMVFEVPAHLNHRFSGEEVIQAVEELKLKLADTSYVHSNPTVQEAYFLAYKKNLETIFFLIKDWEAQKKSQFILNLGERIIVCATGAHTQLCEILYELTQKPSIASWLAELRKNIINEFAENWIAKHKITEGHSIHVHYFCAEHAKEMGWQIPAHSEIKGYDDERFKPASLNEATKEELTHFFKQRYTPKAMLDNLVVNFNALLNPYQGVILKPDENVSIQSILKPFISNNLLNLRDIYDFDEETNAWQIKENFKDYLTKLIIPLLIKENILKSNVTMLVLEQMIPLIETEIERLGEKYGVQDRRVGILNNTLGFLYEVITDDKIDQAAAIAGYIKEVYLNSTLDKYNGLQKFGLILLNMLMIIPLGIPGLIKQGLTGTFFFSLSGKTNDLIGEMNQEIIACTA